MGTSGLKRRDGTGVDAAAVAAFRQQLAGEAIGPADPGYDAARRIWNAIIDRRPGLIARCRGATDVVRAVSFAREHDLLVAVRGGGHNVGGRALCDDGLVIDLSAMRGVHVDPAARTARVQGGATLGDVDRETHLFGLAVPTGVVSRTGIAGLTLGGGVGWLVRRYGYTCDNLLGCELVTAEGAVLTVDAASHPDLFWGLRGGGGNFGIVTSFLYRAHPVHTVLGGMVLHPRAEAAAVLRRYRDAIPDAPEALTAYAGLVSAPDGTPAVAIILCCCAEPEEAERIAAPFRRLGTPVADLVRPLPFPAMQSLLDGAFPDGTRNYWKSSFVDRLTDAAIDRIVEHAGRLASPLSSMVVEFYGGAGSRVAPTETAFAQRHAGYDVGLMAQWTDPAEDAAHIAWAREGTEALRPFASGGYLLNFLAEEPPDTIRAAFGASYPRLAALKKKYDPTNFFSINLNVRPAG